jgi:hypothetical protein
MAFLPHYSPDNPRLTCAHSEVGIAVPIFVPFQYFIGLIIFEYR